MEEALLKQAWNTSDKAFARLALGKQEQLLMVLAEAGTDLSHQPDSNSAGLARAQAHLQRVHALGERHFESLSVGAQECVLETLNRAGVIQGKQDSSQAGLAKQQAFYQRVLALGENRFLTWSARGQAILLGSIVNAGHAHWQQDDGPVGRANAQACYERALAMGEDRFSTLNADAQGFMLIALERYASLRAKTESGSAGRSEVEALRQRALCLAEHGFEGLSPYAQMSLLSLLSGVESQRYNLWRPSTSTLHLGLLWSPWGTDGNIASGRIRSQTPTRNRIADGPGADRWLTRAKAFPAAVNRPQQAETVRLLAQARLAIHRQQSTLQGTGAFLGNGSSQSSVAQTITRSQQWPMRIEGPAHWLLALLCGHAPALLPRLSEPAKLVDGASASQPPDWQPDIEAMAQVLRFADMRFAGGGFKQPYHWAKLLPHPALDISRYAYAKEDGDTTATWLSAWLDNGDPKPLADALQTEWLRWNHATARETDVPISAACSAMHTLADWLDRRGFPDALARAQRACLLGQADKVVAAALDQPAPTAWQHRSKLNDWLGELAAAHAGRRDTEWGLMQTLQRFAQGGLAQPGLTAEQAWNLLESARVGVASRAHTKMHRWTGSDGMHGWDDQAVRNIHQAELRALNDGERHIKAREAGRPLPMPNQVDGRLEPFATMAEEWQRMGVGLQFETPSSAAELLHSGEALVQLWWDEPSIQTTQKGRGLWLIPVSDPQAEQGFELDLLALPQALDGDAVSRMAALWEAARSVPQVEVHGGDDSTAAELSATAQAWQSMTAEDGAARKLLSWLMLECGASGRRLVLVLPHRLANLPWQALQEAVAPERQIELVASVGAWAQSRREFSNNQQIASASAVVMAHEVLDEGGALEAAEVAKMLGVEPNVSNNFADVVNALQLGGPVHLAMHGCFDVDDPQRSALLVDAPCLPAEQSHSASGTRGASWAVRRRARPALRVRKGSTESPAPASRSQSLDAAPGKPDAVRFEPAQLPAWVLADLRIKGDVSLAVCEALQTGIGHGAAEALGPVGMGPLLMAAGARSVVGSLWACETWSAAVFFAFWYDERRSHEAVAALAIARKRLRVLTTAQLLDWVKAVAPALLKAATARCDQTREWPGPFDHPSCWAPFALLGNAPALPGLKQNRTPDAVVAGAKAARTGSIWRAWFQRIWQRVVRRKT